MLVLSGTTDDDESKKNTQIISKILSYLNAKELQNARLLNLAFNNLIITNPELFWAKNVLRVCFEPCDENRLNYKWAQFRLGKLVMNYICPNYHFVKTNLMVPGAVAFFQSSTRHNIKHLRLSNCHVTSDMLIHIVACIGKQLEHLEMRDFSEFKTTLPSDRNRSTPQLCFPSLVTLILCDGKSTEQKELPRIFLQPILSGSFKLEKICFLQFSAGTCQRFTRLLGSMDHKKLKNVLSLEISCATFQDLPPNRQYGLLKQLAWVYMPNLRKLSINFDTNNCSSIEESLENQQFVQTMTDSVANIIDGATATLEWIELVNCPVSNNVFRTGISSLQNLRHVNTRGSFVTRLDDDANPVYEYTIVNKTLRRRQKTTTTSYVDNSSLNVQSNVGDNNSDTMTRMEVYILMCALFTSVAIIHTVTQWIFGSYIGEKLEVLIYAVIVFVIIKGKEISGIWSSSFS